MQSDFNAPAGSEALANPSAVTASEPTANQSVQDQSGRDQAGLDQSKLSQTWSRIARFRTALYRQTLVDPIEQGRLRDVVWPFGLRSIVLAGYVVFAAAGLLVILSGQIRGRSSLIVSSTGLGLPEQMVWPLVVLLSFGLASAMSVVLSSSGGTRPA